MIKIEKYYEKVLDEVYFIVKNMLKFNLMLLMLIKIK